MAVPVDIYVMDESSVPVPIQNAQVSVFDPGTHNLVASATTDVDGLAAFSLVGSVTPGTEYEVRFYKLGVNFHGLKSILVTDPVVSGAPNKFDHTGADSNILPVSGSPYLCRCTGVFVDFTGQPIANKTIRFMSKGCDLDKTPKLWNNAPSRMVSPDEMEFRTDGDGRISTNLVRTGKFEVTWGGDDDTVWCITVPDRDSANLVDLVHPFPLLWDWDDTLAPSDAVSLAIGETVELPVLVSFSDFAERGAYLSTFFDLVNSYGSIVEATYDNDRGLVVLRGVASGSSTLTPQLKTGILPNRWPVPTVILPSLAITVT